MVEHWIENPRIVVQFHFWAIVIPCGILCIISYKLNYIMIIFHLLKNNISCIDLMLIEGKMKEESIFMINKNKIIILFFENEVQGYIYIKYIIDKYIQIKWWDKCISKAAYNIYLKISLRSRNVQIMLLLK